MTQHTGKKYKVSYFELPADDVQRSTAFYSTVFGWDTPPMGDDSVFALTTASDNMGNPTEIWGINGDIQKRNPHVDRPLMMICVDDVTTHLDVIKTNGGTIVTEKQETPEFWLSWAVFADTEWNHIGIYAFQQG
jgi:predicted enzyme related to lactoylglutathione lyase